MLTIRKLKIDYQENPVGIAENPSVSVGDREQSEKCDTKGILASDCF